MIAPTTPDYYFDMGLHGSANKRAILRAYRKLSLALHPDRHPAEEKEKWHVKFVKVRSRP